MRTVMTGLAVLTLVACDRSEEPATVNTVEGNLAADANAMATPAGLQLNETSWQFTREGKDITESIDAAGNYVAWSGDEHVDHGTAVMKDGKACFTSAMNDEGQVCWTSQSQTVEIGQSMESTSDKGETLTVTRIAYLAPPSNVMP